MCASTKDLAHISMRLGWSCEVSACACKHQGLQISAYNGWYLHTHRAEGVSAFIGLYEEEEHELAFFLLLWRSARLSALACLYGELSVCLHVSVYIWSWACIFLCRQVSRVQHVSVRVCM